MRNVLVTAVMFVATTVPVVGQRPADAQADIAIIESAMRALIGDGTLRDSVTLVASSATMDRRAGEAVARALSVRLQERGAVITCGNERPPVCRVSRGNIVVTVEKPVVRSDTAEVSFSMVRSSEAAVGVYSQIWMVKLVRTGTKWAAKEKTLVLES